MSTFTTPFYNLTAASVMDEIFCRTTLYAVADDTKCAYIFAKNMAVALQVGLSTVQGFNDNTKLSVWGVPEDKPVSRNVSRKIDGPVEIVTHPAKVWNQMFSGIKEPYFLSLETY